jgi:hypothetical protein
VFHTGDACFYNEEINPVQPLCTPGLRIYQNLLEKDRKARLGNQQPLREMLRDH